MTLVLGIGTSSPALSLALFEDGVQQAGEHRIIGRGHAEALIPAIAELMSGRCADAIVVDIGPGSFTGIRVGLAAAHALGLAWHAPVSGVMATTLVAAAAFAEAPDAMAVTVLLDAGRGQLYAQHMNRHFQAGDLEICRPEDLSPEKGVVLGGAPATAFGNAPLAGTGPDMAALFHLPAALRSLVPAAHYVRPPDAKLPEA